MSDHKRAKCKPRQIEESDQQRKVNERTTDIGRKRQRDAGVLNKVPQIEARGKSLPCSSVTN